MGKLWANTDQDNIARFSWNPYNMIAFVLGVVGTIVLGIAFLIIVLNFGIGIASAMITMLVVSGGFTFFVVLLLIYIFYKYYNQLKWFMLGILVGIILMAIIVYLIMAWGYIAGGLAYIGGIL